MGGHSGIPPLPANESRFVADDDPGSLDTQFDVVEAEGVVTVSIDTTRHVGAVDGDGFLVNGDAAVRAGRLAGTTSLTIRARIMGFDTSGILGQGDVNVRVVLHRGEAHQRSLGPLHGDYGTDWQDFALTVRTVDLKFPDDPCPGQPASGSCGLSPAPRPNKVSFVFDTAVPLTFEVDWLTLEPRHLPGLASRPVLLLHGWGQTAADMGPGTVWADALSSRDIPWYAADLASKGIIQDNGAELIQVVSDVARRFGVERVNVVGFGKGGLDARDYVQRNKGVETLIMLASPNQGSFTVDMAILPIALLTTDYVVSTPYMVGYNYFYRPNSHVLYVALSAYYDSVWARYAAHWRGLNDESVSVDSVGALPYASNEPPYRTSTTDAPSQGICATQALTNHNCLRYNVIIVSDQLPRYLETPGAPLPQGPPPLPQARLSRPYAEGAATGAGAPQCVGAEAATVPGAGVSENHLISVDEVDTAIFNVFTEGAFVTLQLVSPSGRRVGPDTPSADSSVVYASPRDAEFCWYTGYQIAAPETGTWTVEVTGTGAAPPDSQYGVATFATLLAGLGVAMTVGVTDEHPVVGGDLTMTATLTSDGLPVEDATVTAQVAQPGQAAATTVVLRSDPTTGDGEYRGVFGPAPVPGLYAIAVCAQGAGADFTRQAVIPVTVAPSATRFSGVFTDRGVDTDLDGRYNQLIIEVGVEVDVAADYGVFGTLTDTSGTTIEQVRVEQYLDPGAQTVSLRFDGARLYDLGTDGPYVLGDLMIEDIVSLTGLALGPSHTTNAYTHDEFQRPICLLTGNTTDCGVNTDPGDQLPYEELLIQVEVDTLVEADVLAASQLYAEDGTFVATGRTFSSLTAGANLLDFRFQAPDIYRVGKAGPYNLRLFSMWEVSTEQRAISLRVPGVVAVTRPYPLEDFGRSPVFTIGGTVTGLAGQGLELTDYASFLSLQPGNGPFAFGQPRPVGSAYDVRITAPPINPIQICSIAGATGTVGPAGVTDILVSCETPAPEVGLDLYFGSSGKTVAHGGAAAVALQCDGKILLAGDLTLTRYDCDGIPDGGFGSGGSVPVDFGASSSYAAAQSVAVQADGSIVVAGYAATDTQGMHYDFALTRFTSDGLVDSTFGSGGTGTVYTDFAGGTDEARSLRVQCDGRIVAAGLAATAGPPPTSACGVARYTPDGIPDGTFGGTGTVMTTVAGGPTSASAMSLQPDGKIVVAVAFSAPGEETASVGLVRYLVDGGLDPEFGDGGIARPDLGSDFSVQPAALGIQADGMLILAGSARALEGPSMFALARLDAAGNPDTRLGGTGLVTTPFGTDDAVAQALGIDPDGRIVVAGYAGPALSTDFAVARYTTDGGLDSTFGDGGTLTIDFFGDLDRAQCVAIQPDGKIVVAGSVSRAMFLGLVRLLA